MGPAFMRKYNTAITAGTAQSIKIPIVKRGVVDFAVSADWTPAAGDVKVSKDGGAAANIATLPAAVAMGNTAYWEFVFSGTELSCGTLVVTISDSATKAVEDQEFIIETFGNASALYPIDWTDIVRMGLTALPNAAAEASGGLFTRGTGAGQINQDANGRIDANVKTWIGGTIPAVNVTGVPLVDAKYLLGTIFSTPATAGVLDVNVKNMNNIAATSITTINANVGTTQPVNFTGTSSTAYVKTDVIDIAGTGQTAKDLGAINVTNLNTLSGHDPGATLGTSTLTQAQVTGGAYSVQSSSCVLGDTRLNAIPPYVTGTVSASPSPTSTQFTTDRSESANVLNDRLFIFTSGALAGEAKLVWTYSGSGLFLWDEAWSTAPTAGDTFTIVSIHAHSKTQIAATNWSNSGRTLTALGFTLGASDLASGTITAAKFAADAIDSSALAASAAQEIRNAITGGSYALDTDANGRIRIVDGTGTGEIDTTSGGVLVSALSTQAKADVNAEADTALSDYGALKPTVSGRTLDVSTTGEAGIDWANIGSPTTTVNLSGTTVLTATDVASAIAALNNLSTTDVKNQAVAALATDTYALPGQVTPSTTPTLSDAIMQLFQSITNPSDQDSSKYQLYNRAGTTVHQKRTASDDGTTFSLGALVTGP